MRRTFGRFRVMPEKYVGICVDGSRATMVNTIDSLATSYATVDLGDVGESVKVLIKNVKQRKKSPPIRIVVSAPTSMVKSMDVTAKDTASYDDFQELLYTALPVDRDTTSVAGMVHNPEDMVGDKVCPGAAASLATSVLSEVYNAMGSLRCEVVSTPLVFAAHNGVWLGIQQGIASLSLLANGRIVAYRQLRLGGLSSVVSHLLGSSTNVKAIQTRVEQALVTVNNTDTQASTEVGRYMRMLTTEISQTIDFWRRQGEVIENDGMILAYGPGAVSPLLDDALHEGGFVRAICSAIDRQLVNVASAQRLDSYPAFLAAVSVGKNMPYVSFTNPNYQALKKAQRRKLKIASTLVGTLAALASLGLFVVKPIVDVKRKESATKTSLVDVEGRFAPLQDMYVLSEESLARAAVNDEVLADQPDWAAIYQQLMLSAPPAATIVQMTATSSEGVVIVNIAATLPGGRYEDMSAWLTRLGEINGVTSAWTRGFNERQGKVTVDLTVNFAYPQSATDEVSQ